ncbi:MAG: UDP-N-acetylglucosamine 1-carboxyvinyltransferase [Alphaproteobacteria bacterium]
MTAFLKIQGGIPLKGTITISGAKNAALPLMTASLLTDEELILENVPQLSDINSMACLLERHGVEVNSSQDILSLKATKIKNTMAPYEYVRRMRASILTLGPLVARCKKAKVSLPGGCAIGTRPVDFHLNGLRQLGAEIDINQGYIEAFAPFGLKGANITMSMISVTGTENIMMAACLAKGETRIINAAREPEIVNLAECLNKMGAKIENAGSDIITIYGVEHLKGTKHGVIPDRIETGTYIMAAAITGGELIIRKTEPLLLASVIDILKKAGVCFDIEKDSITVRSLESINCVDVMTEPYPGLPTDLQAQMMALFSVAKGASLITETIFENRFMHVQELCRMGANITVHRSSALVKGVKCLNGASVMATDLRASVSLVLAALAAEGETIVNRIYHLDRGYSDIENKLSSCGAIIERCYS